MYEDKTTTPYSVETKDVKIEMSPTAETVKDRNLQALCEKDGPNKGTWNETFKTCNCEGKAFFDEAKGCVESTQEYTNAEDALKTLYEQFNTQLEIIKNQNTPQ